MRPIYFIVLCMSLCFTSKAQSDPNPKVVVLYPNEIVVSDNVREQLKVYEKEIEITDEIKNKYIPSELSDNWRLIRTRELDFLGKQDFFGNMTYKTSSNIIYEVYEYEANPLVYPIREKCKGDIESLRSLAQNHNVIWVVNILKLEFSSENKLIATIQLYNLTSHRVFINEKFIGDTTNPGGNLGCNEGSWDCAANNVVKQSVFKIFDILDKYRKYW